MYVSLGRRYGQMLGQHILGGILYPLVPRVEALRKALSEIEALPMVITAVTQLVRDVDLLVRMIRKDSIDMASGDSGLHIVQPELPRAFLRPVEGSRAAILIAVIAKMDNITLVVPEKRPVPLLLRL